MAQPMIVDLPHKLGAAEARRRIATGLSRIGEHIPGGAAMESGWSGDRLDLRLAAMNQQIVAAIEVGDANVRVELTLPPALGFFGAAIEAGLRGTGARLLEDRPQS